MTSKSQEIDVFLNSYPEQVRKTAFAARRFLGRILPEAQETLDVSAKLIGYGYGPGYKGVVCTLILSQKGVKLGIFRGAELKDPNRLMAGAGKVHRHVQLYSLEDLERRGLTQLLRDALTAWKKRSASDG